MSYPKEAEQGLKALVDVSNRYGENPAYVLAGGGNTSWKSEDSMFVKGSGTSLATIGPEGFVFMDLKKLDNIWKTNYSDDIDTREADVLEDLMEARFPSEAEKRPSVETLLHGLFPFRFVVHLHPALVNGVTCAVGGKQFIKDFYGPRAIWLPVTDPGYILALRVKEEIEKSTSAGNDFPKLVFLQNHGVFVAADTIEEIDMLYSELFEAIYEKVIREPDTQVKTLGQELDREVKNQLSSTIRNAELYGFCTDDILAFCQDDGSFEPLSLAFTPDHIVYYGYKPLYVKSIKEIEPALKQFIADEEMVPKIIAVKDIGAFAVAESSVEAERAMQLFLDDVKIAVYAESFGGYQFMPKENIQFIRNWEVEKYRSKVAGK